MSNPFFKITVLILCQIVCQITCACELKNFQWAVTIRLSTKRLPQICGGTLLHTRWVLTAAHCAFGIDNPSELTVMALVDPPGSFDSIKVQKIFLNENYDPKTLENDLSLLFLVRHFPPGMKFGKLPGATFTNSCDGVTVIGWVRNRARKREESNVMKPFCMDEYLVEVELCKLLFGMLHVDDDVILCTMFSEGGYQPCKGDSGGPLVCEGVVIGVVSWGVECNIRNKPAVFGRVDAAIDFINNTLKKYDYNLTRTAFLNSTVYFVSSEKMASESSPLLFALVLSLMLFVN